MAVMTITTTAIEDARIVVAFGHYQNLGRNATGAEVKAAVVSFVKDIVQQDEARVANATALSQVVPPILISPT